MCTNNPKKNYSGPDLGGHDFSNECLENADFSNAILAHACFDGADLTDVNFSGATLQFATFVGTMLDRPDFSNCDLSSSVFRNTELKAAKFCHSDLSLSSFLETKMQYADFSNADLSGSKLFNSTLYGSELKHSVLTDTDFMGSNLRGCKNFIFDESRIQNIKIGGKYTDPWSILVRTYTGAKLFISLLFLTIFVLPHAIEASTWIALTKFYALNTNLGVISCKDTCTDYPLWKFMVGGTTTGISRFFTVTSTSLLIAFNVLKFFLTSKLSAAKYNEEREHVTPAHRLFNWSTFRGNKMLHLKEYFSGYSWLVTFHKMVKILMFVTIPLCIIKIFLSATSVISIPS